MPLMCMPPSPCLMLVAGCAEGAHTNGCFRRRCCRPGACELHRGLPSHGTSGWDCSVQAVQLWLGWQSVHLGG